MAHQPVVKRVLLATLGMGSILVAAGFAPRGAGPSPATPPEVVATYETLADGILALKKTESNLVTSFLAATHAHAKGKLEAAQAALKAGDRDGAQADVEDLATLVAHLGTEGDNSVARVRKRLLEGGHHHNAEGEAKGIYDEGFVVVTRAAKKRFLDASRAIGLLKGSPSADGLEREWKNVQSAWMELLKERK
jgi:hypothetical protein